MLKTKIFFIILHILLGLFFSGFSVIAEESQSINNLKAGTETFRPDGTSCEFSAEEKKYLSELKKRGKIIIASRIITDVYKPQPKGMAKGFNYSLASSFAEYIGVDLEVKVVSFKDYFSKDGNVPERVKTDGNFSYTPDLINQVDMYVDTITIIPWRQKLLRMIKIIPTRIMIITRKGEEINELKELGDKSISILKNSSYEVRIREIQKELGINPKIVFADDTPADTLLVVNGFADVSLLDANRVIKSIGKYYNLNVSLPASDIQYLSWAVNKNNRILSSILEKYIASARKSGLMNRLWYDHFGITLEEYYDLLKIN